MFRLKSATSLKSAQRLFNLAALAGCLFAAGACAAEKQTPPPPPQMQQRFVQMDVNKDGKVVLEEFNAYFPSMHQRAFVIIDKNGDKAIDETEWLEFVMGHGAPQSAPERGAPMNNIPGDPLIPPPDSNDLPLMQPPNG